MTNWSIAVRFRRATDDPDAVLIWDHVGSSSPSIDGIPALAETSSDPVVLEILRSWQAIRRELSCMAHLLAELDGLRETGIPEASVPAG